jgi:hypothetical protein
MGERLGRGDLREQRRLALADAVLAADGAAGRRARPRQGVVGELACVELDEVARQQVTFPPNDGPLGM